MEKGNSSHYGPGDARPAIWVYLEQNGRSLAPVSLELLTRGREMATEAGWELVGMLLGAEADLPARRAIAYGADRVLIARDPMLVPFSVDAHSQAAHQLLLKEKPTVFLLGATPDGRDLAGRLAVRLRTGLNADCTALTLDLERGILVCEVSGFGGGVLALIEMVRHRPQMATVRPGVFTVGQADDRRKGRIDHTAVQLDESTVRSRMVERVVGQQLDLTQSSILIVGGRGVDGKFFMLDELAALLKGSVGATRPPVDDGYIERERQIGQTGIICRPKVVINCGVSGAFQYMVGVREADMIISINSDPEAPIFEESDYCIIGDVHEVIPALIAALKGADNNAGSAESAAEVAHA